MADVGQHAGEVRSAGLVEQISLVAGLRWRVLRNQLRRKSSRLDLIGMIWASIFAAGLVFGLSFAFFWGAYVAISTAHFGWLLLLFWCIFLFWQVFPLFLAGLGSNFEFRGLLRFPLTLSAFYLIALAYGLADFAALASVCWLLAMAIGAAVADPSVMSVMLPVIALFVLFNITCERLIGSWFERLMARRRTREMVFGLIILLSVSAQFIRPLFLRYEHGAPAWLSAVLPYLGFLPPSLASSAIAGAANGEWRSVFSGTAGLILYIAVLSVFLWRMFAAQFRGEQLSEAPAPARIAAGRTAARAAGAPDSLDLLPPQVAAVVRKDFRYLVRNGFVAISLLMPALLVFLFSSQFGGPHPWVTHRGVSSEFFFPGMIGYLMLMLMMPAYNCFAYEGRGLQTYFTVPVHFRDVFLGKNIVQCGVLALEMLVSIAVMSWRIGLPSWPVFTATLAGVVFAVAGQFSIANWASLNFPRKLEFGTMRGQRNSGAAVWVGFGVQLVLGSVCALVLFAGRWTGNAWLPAEAFAGLAIAAIAGYFASLEALTNLAEKKKETLLEAFCR